MPRSHIIGVLRARSTTELTREVLREPHMYERLHALSTHHAYHEAEAAHSRLHSHINIVCLCVHNAQPRSSARQKSIEHPHLHHRPWNAAHA